MSNTEELPSPEVSLDEIFQSDPRELTEAQRLSVISALREARKAYKTKSVARKAAAAKKPKKSSDENISVSLDDLDIKL